MSEFGQVFRRTTKTAAFYWPEAILVVAALIIAGWLWHGACPALERRLIHSELMQTSVSPDSKWAVDVWYKNPGAMASAWVTVEARRTGSDNGHEILRLYSSDLRDAQWANDHELLIVWQSSTSLSVGGFAAEIHTLEVLWGSLLAMLGVFLLVFATLRSGFVVYRLLVARSRLLWRDWVHLSYQVVGVVLLVLGVLWASGVIWG